MTPPRVNPIVTTRPSIARVQNWLLRDTENYAPDRRLGLALAEAAPWYPGTVRDTRAGMPAAVMHLVSTLGIRQIIDLGCGLPSRAPAPTVYSVARSVLPTARVVYVDHDPHVMAHAATVLVESDATSAISADLRTGLGLCPGMLCRYLDLEQPIGVLCRDLLPWLTDTEAAGLLSLLREQLSPGSAVSIVHVASDAAPRGAQLLAELYGQAGIEFRPRTFAQLDRLLDAWRIGLRERAATPCVYEVVAHIPTNRTLTAGGGS
ncbi:SAM-dependent methyltransferase [Streptomyces aureocirculatus]|uniref:SAM-dependent methyltransferase n=1 Tax=Streptomyces aureocirculatus TaxID=67275 RepID=UPI0006903364|nr:SAM-dependent methyltransferase [Streptomyces aureocirculatus]